LIGGWRDRSGRQKLAIITVVVVVGLAVLGAALGSRSPSGGTRCETLPSEAAAHLASALPGFAPPGATLGSPVVVKSNEERPPDFEPVYFVAALVDARAALWAMNRMDGTGLVASVNDYAYQVSGMGRSSGWAIPLTENDDGAREALSCLLKSLPSSTESRASGGGSEVAAWNADVTRWGKTMSSAFRKVGNLLQDQTFMNALLRNDSAATAKLAVPLATISNCSTTFPAAPTGNSSLRAIETEMKDICQQYKHGVTDFKQGLDSGDASLITKGGNEVASANSRAIDLAQRISNLASGG
jgi:hypothetical protein